MKIYVTGSDGQVGKAVVNLFRRKNIDVTGLTREILDLTDEKAIRAYFSDKNFTHLVHCAAYTEVDNAEKNKLTCLITNTDATRILTDICFDRNATMIYLSTDYVFDGKRSTPYYEHDYCRPVNYYGLTKLLGEGDVLMLPKKYIIRTSRVFGDGNNFVKTMLRLADENKPLKLVSDEISSPTFANDLAGMIYECVCSDRYYGIFNCTNSGYCSWYDFAKRIFEITGKKVDISPCERKSYPALASRPQYSVLSPRKMTDCGYTPLPSWEDALERYLNTI